MEDFVLLAAPVDKKAEIMLKASKVKNSSRELVVNLSESLSILNSKGIEWQIDKNAHGNFICTEFKFKNSKNAIEALRFLNDLQELTDHHSSFVMENFSSLKIELCTHRPKYGLTEIDFSFAELLVSEILNLI